MQYDINEAEKHFRVGLLLRGLSMTKTILVFVAFLSFGVASAQQPPPLGIPPAAFRPVAAAAPVQQIVNLGDVVINVVIAKVLGDGDDAELTIAKFGAKETNQAPRVVTTMKAEQIQRTVVVNGESKVQTYTVHVPITTVVNQKQNFTPTEQDRSVPVSTVQAFDLKGNPVEAADWTKRLETPKHVLLLRSPIDETNKLNPFYSAILREDMLLLFLKGDSNSKKGPIVDRITIVYDVKEFPVFNLTAWIDKASIQEDRANQRLVVMADAETHKELSLHLKSLREEIAKKAKE